MPNINDINIKTREIMLEYLFNYDVTVNLLAVAGIYIVVLWLFENLRSPVQILFNVVRPLFQPESNKSLAERYGDWAGKYQGFIFRQ